MTDRLKKLFYFGVMVIIASFIYVQFIIPPAIPVPPAIPTPPTEEVIESADDTGFVGPIKTDQNIDAGISQPPVDSDEETWTGSAKQQAEMQRWFESHGWFDPSPLTQDDYKSYSKETLIAFAERGDVKALELLAFHSRVSSKTREYYEKAAVYGSTHALYGIINNMLHHTSVTEESSYEDKRRLMIEVYAYKLVATTRGDYAVAPDWDVQNTATKLKFEATSYDREDIHRRAEEIYAQLELNRKNLGLPSFDNTLSPTAKAFYKYIGGIKE